MLRPSLFALPLSHVRVEPIWASLLALALVPAFVSSSPDRGRGKNFEATPFPRVLTTSESNPPRS